MAKRGNLKKKFSPYKEFPLRQGNGLIVGTAFVIPDFYFPRLDVGQIETVDFRFGKDKFSKLVHLLEKRKNIQHQKHKAETTLQSNPKNSASQTAFKRIICSSKTQLNAINQKLETEFEYSSFFHYLRDDKTGEIIDVFFNLRFFLKPNVLKQWLRIVKLELEFHSLLPPYAKAYSHKSVRINSAIDFYDQLQQITNNHKYILKTTLRNFPGVSENYLLKKIY
jgi:hypothetical protein